MKILVTGSAGFLAGYLVPELLDRGHDVVGVDNFSTYGKVARSYDSHERYLGVEGDCKNVDLMRRLIEDCDQVVAMAARVGGVAYFHECPYDLLAENDRIIAATLDAAIWAHQYRQLKKVNVLSSPLVFESNSASPTAEGEQYKLPPPASTSGFQKLSCEYYARAAREQYRLPCTIVRPFDCIGLGEKQFPSGLEMLSGNLRLAMCHVVPELVQKVVKGHRPVSIPGSGGKASCFTYAGDVARGLADCVEKAEAENEDFNLAASVSLTLVEVAERIWKKKRPTETFEHACNEPWLPDGTEPVPDVSKAERVLGFKADTPLETVLDEMFPWIELQMEAGRV